MSYPPNISKGTKIPKWFLLGALIFSVFIMPGFTGDTANLGPNVYKIELLEKSRSGAQKQSDFKKLFHKFFTSPAPIIAGIFPDINTLIIHERKSKTTFDYLSELVLSYDKPGRHFRLKTIPPSSEDPLPNPFRA